MLKVGVSTHRHETEQKRVVIIAKVGLQNLRLNNRPTKTAANLHRNGVLGLKYIACKHYHTTAKRQTMFAHSRDCCPG
jgi:hypothetical protein